MTERPGFGYPPEFQHNALVALPPSIASAWGDSTVAGASHEAALWNESAGTPPASDGEVLQEYAEITGYNPPARD